MKMKKLLILAVVLSALLSVGQVNPVSGCVPPPPCKTALIAGQNWDAGVVTVYDDGTNLYVTFETTGGWILGETHLYVGTAKPTKSAPGKFPYSGQTKYTFSLLDDLGVVDGDKLYIAAHAVVSKCGQPEETAWADTWGTPIREKGGWAMYFGYTVGDVCFKP